MLIKNKKNKCHFSRKKQKIDARVDILPHLLFSNFILLFLFILKANYGR